MNNSPINNLEGQRFGSLEVLYYEKVKGRRGQWVCECDCGNTKRVLADQLTMGRTTHCGCMHRKPISTRNDETVLKALKALDASTVYEVMEFTGLKCGASYAALMRLYERGEIKRRKSGARFEYYIKLPEHRAIDKGYEALFRAMASARI